MRRFERGWRLGVGGSLLLAATSACAQTHVVHKPDTVVRALGVYEWTGTETKPTASRFVPVTLFIDGHLQDAAVYLARPVPFALQTGTLFELEKAGVPQGTLDLLFARHEEGTDASPQDDGWMGYGVFQPLHPLKEEASHLQPGKPTPVEVSGGKPHPSFAAAPDKPGAVPSTSTTEDNSVDPDRPTLNRKQGNPSDTPAPAVASPAPASTTPDTDSDADRPTLKRPSGAESTTPPTQAGSGSGTQSADSSRPVLKRPGDAGSTASSQSTDSGKDSDDDPDRPTLRRRTEAQRQAARKQHDSSSVSGSNASLNDDPDRPILHHGKAPGALDADDLPPLRGLPPGLQRQVGVSDAANRPEHDFARPWEGDGERTAVLDRMREEARSLLAGYASPPVQPRPSASPQKRRTATKPAGAPVASFVDEILRGYTLSYGGAATYVYTAASPGVDGSTRYVAVVAQREQGGDLKTAMKSVTDGTHLDRTPRMVLVDAVDAEASNRASLLFELRAQTTRQFSLYRVIGAEAQQIFVSGSSD